MYCSLFIYVNLSKIMRSYCKVLASNPCAHNMIFSLIRMFLCVCVSFKTHCASLSVLCVSVASTMIKPILLASLFSLGLPAECHRKQHSQHSTSSDWWMHAAPIDTASVHWPCLIFCACITPEDHWLFLLWHMLTTLPYGHRDGLVPDFDLVIGGRCL